MAEEERYEVVGGGPEQLTLEDGTVASVPPGSDPVKVRKDRKFRQARRDGNIRRVFVEVEEGDDQLDGDFAHDAEAALEVEEGDDDLPDLGTPVGDLGLSENVVDALESEGVDNVRGVLAHGDLRSITGIGDARIEDIENALESSGFDSPSL